MIAGLGVDLLDRERIDRVWLRHRDRFARRILGPSEYQQFALRLAASEDRGLAYLANRFAAKEAFSKAIGLGIRSPMTWRHVQVLNEPCGRPALHLSGPIKEWYDQRFGRIHISLSDERRWVIAQVILESL